MNQYKIGVTYTRLDGNGDIVTKIMYFVTLANSLEEARNLVQETAMTYIDRANGELISVN